MTASFTAPLRPPWTSSPGLRRPAAIALVAAVMAAACPARATDVADQRGHVVHFASPARRAIFLPMPAASTYIAIDGTEANIAGMNALSAAAMRGGVLGRLYPGFTRIATDIAAGAGTAPNVESILALRPDAVFQWATADDALAVLDRAGLPVLGMRYGTQGDMAGYTLMMGQVAGREGRADELNRRQDEAMRGLAAALGDVPQAARPRVLYLGRVTDTLRVGGKGSYNDFCIRLAGGANVAEAAASGAVTVEQILTWNPQVILLGNFDTAMPSDIYDDPRWQGVEAVRSRRVYRMPLGGYRWDPPSQESALAWVWLAGLLHPDRAATDLRQAMRDWFQFLYGHALTDAEIDPILYAAENRGSAGYARYLAR